MGFEAIFLCKEIRFSFPSGLRHLGSLPRIGEGPGMGQQHSRVAIPSPNSYRGSAKGIPRKITPFGLKKAKVSLSGFVPFVIESTI